MPSSSDLSPVIRTRTKESFPFKLTNWRTQDEAETIHRRTDHQGPAGALIWHESRRYLPRIGHRGSDVLSLEVQIWRHGRIRSEASQGSGGREQQTQKDARRTDVGECSHQGCTLKKVVKPAQRKQVVRHWVDQGWLSERKACQVAGISRSGLRYQCRRPDSEKALKAALQEKATRYPRYGYLMLHGLLRNEGLVVNKKRTYRLYTEAGLQVRTKKRRKLIRPRVIMNLPARPNERWSMDFVHDQLACGRRFRVLNIVDDCSRECVGQVVDVSISGQRVARYLTELLAQRGRPRQIVCDNGTEFTSKAMFFWSRDQHIRLSFIQPGKPTQNAFVESFNGKFRDTCLNQHWFRSLDEARETIETWRRDYNEVRPHSSLGYQPPSIFAGRIA